jgi:hypothetical protein
MRQHPWVCALIALTLAFSLFGMGYAADDSAAAATERWESTTERGEGAGVWTLSPQADGTVMVAGEWTYEDSITCPFSGGSAQISGPAVSFTVRGTATYSLAPPGHQHAPFTLKVKGETKAGQGQGTYAINFNAPNWPPGFSGEWQATRIEGGGITE